MAENLTKDDIEAMRETLKILGTKSENYYDKCSNAQVKEEYDRMMGPVM